MRIRLWEQTWRSWLILIFMVPLMAILRWEMITPRWKASGSGKLGTGRNSSKGDRIILGAFLCCQHAMQRELNTPTIARCMWSILYDSVRWALGLLMLDGLRYLPDYVACGWGKCLSTLRPSSFHSSHRTCFVVNIKGYLQTRTL